MTEATDRVLLCQQMLGELGTRSTITSLTPPDGSTEAFYCNLFYDSTLFQVLRAAHWNFAGRTDTLGLWKALPGTPENPTIPPGFMWSNRVPAPPWLYSYVHPGGGVIQIRRVRPQSSAMLPAISGVPLFGGITNSANYNRLPSVPFEVASDPYDSAGNFIQATNQISTLTIATPGSGYQSGDYITPTQSGATYGHPAAILVGTANNAGNVLTAFIENGGTFVTTGSGAFTQLATTGSGSGFTFNATFTPNNQSIKVVLTNAQNALMDFTAADASVAQYDPGFQDAFMQAMEGKLALALLGDKAMYKAKLEEANQSILEARVRDGNEGLTIQDHVPDWLQVRGVGSMTPVDRYFPAYGPLFAV